METHLSKTLRNKGITNLNYVVETLNMFPDGKMVLILKLIFIGLAHLFGMKIYLDNWPQLNNQE